MDILIKADIVVVGGGASGIAAAIEAKKTAPDLTVVIAERLDRTGKKILVTGNGRCNLTNKNLSEKFYHGSVSGVMEIIKKTGSTEDFFRNMGVLCTSDSEGRMYPYSRNASSVLTALRLTLKSLNIPEICGFCVCRTEKKGNRYIVSAEDGRMIECRRIIIACGGYASPANGTDGRMIKMFRDMGYKTEKICPAVAPLRVSPEQVKGLKGVRVHGRVSAVSGGRVLHTETGEIQFTENSVSGICVFNLAYLFSEYEGKLSVEADLLPEMNENEAEALIRETVRIRKENTLEELLNGIFVKNLSVYILKRALKLPMTTDVSSLGDNEIKKITRVIKHLVFEITGCSSWQNAQVTAGGISGSCVNNMLQSRKDDGIFFSGEILDVDGECGGYNLEWAWSSGRWAGRNCAVSLVKSRALKIIA